MSDHEHPQSGGSYTRQKDGSLKRNDETPASEPAPAAKPDAKTARSTKEK